jgi:hypothetical protein
MGDMRFTLSLALGMWRKEGCVFIGSGRTWRAPRLLSVARRLAFTFQLFGEIAMSNNRHLIGPFFMTVALAATPLLAQAVPSGGGAPAPGPSCKTVVFPTIVCPPGQDILSGNCRVELVRKEVCR